MAPEQIEDIQTSFAKVAPIAPAAAALFKGDMAEQGNKQMAALAVRHVKYGVKPEHYAPVGAALIWTLEQGLKHDFTPKVQEAWTAAYNTLSSAMIVAAYPAPEPVDG